MNPKAPLETQSGSSTDRRLKLARTVCSMLSNVDLHSKKLTKASVLKRPDNVCNALDRLGLIRNGNVSASDLFSFSDKMAGRYLCVIVRCDEEAITERERRAVGHSHVL